MPIVMTVRSKGVDSGLSVDLEVYYNLEMGGPNPAKDRTYTVEVSWETGDYEAREIREGGVADGNRVSWKGRRIEPGNPDSIGLELTGSSDYAVETKLIVND